MDSPDFTELQTQLTGLKTSGTLLYMSLHAQITALTDANAALRAENAEQRALIEKLRQNRAQELVLI